MDLHRRLLHKRQGLGGILSGLFPTSSSSTLQSTGNTGGIIGEFTSVLGGLTTDFLPSSAPSSAATSSALTHSSSSSTGSITTSTSAHLTSTTTSHSSSFAVSTTPTSTLTSTTSAPVAVYTSLEGTSIVYVTSTAPVASATASSTSFLQDHALEGGIFALVGIVALIIIFVVITWTIRKRRRNRLERDLAAAVTFDPGATGFFERQEDSVEKHRLSASTSGHGYGVQQPAYLSHEEYHGPLGYGQYPGFATFRSPSPVLYQTSPPAVPQSSASQSGANLTRKYSDRKPVPPLLPDPAHVSVSPPFYQQ